MKKFIIIGAVILVSLPMAQALYKIDKNTKIMGWLRIGGDIVPIYDQRYTLGDSSHWWDSCYVAHGKFHDITIDSGLNIIYGGNTGIRITKNPSTTSDTGLVIYWQDDNHWYMDPDTIRKPALMIIMDTLSEAPESTQVTAIKIIGNALAKDCSEDFYLWFDNNSVDDNPFYWSAYGAIKTKNIGVEQMDNAWKDVDFTFTQSWSNRNVIFLIEPGKDGNFIWRDGSMAPDADFWQIQDSSGTIRYRINNAGGVQIGGVGAVLDSVIESGTQDTLFYFTSGRKYYMTLAP